MANLNISIWPTLPDTSLSAEMLAQIEQWNRTEEPLFGDRHTENEDYNFWLDEAYDRARDDALCFEEVA